MQDERSQHKVRSIYLFIFGREKINCQKFVTSLHLLGWDATYFRFCSKNRAKGMKILCARVYDSKKRVVDEQLTAERKRQIGTAERSERIRTYNYPQVCAKVTTMKLHLLVILHLQDRVTDHRLGLTVYGVSKFLVGTEMLDSVTSALKAEEEASSLATLLQSMEQR